MLLTRTGPIQSVFNVQYALFILTIKKKSCKYEIYILLNIHYQLALGNATMSYLLNSVTV